MAGARYSSLNPHAPEYIPITPLPLPLPTIDPPPPQNVHPILKGHETTVKLENIPLHYNRKKLMDFLDDYCLLENQKARDSNKENPHVFAFDFVYLPMNFKWTGIEGYGFVNFTDHKTLLKFFRDFSERAKTYPDSEISVQMSIAEMQGKNALMERFKSERFLFESDEFHPVSFNPARNGSRASVKVNSVGIFQLRINPTD
ncbi:protein terminal ear1-like [Solanum lycopersicum]|uniref:Mei2-like C-terminal RNA recognition motif domain-containing protein n=1 Tax=Solanum lycopersicum TaxID=4081 RepID=K4B3N7_SOLLC|nr:protein terminal ear1-like [Solanum lycopersicum]